MNSRDERDCQAMHYPQSSNNRYIYDTRNPLIHFRPHSASVVNTHRFKQDLYMQKARMRKESFVQEKKSGLDQQQFSERKRIPLKQIALDKDKDVKKIQIINATTNSLRNISKRPSISFKQANDLYIYMKATSRKNNQSCYIDSREVDLYNVSPVKENIPQSSKKPKAQLLRPLNLSQIQLDNHLKQQRENKMVLKEQIFNSPKIKRKQSNVLSVANENSPLKSSKKLISPIKRERQEQNEFDIFQKQTFFEKLRLKFGSSQILSMRYSPDDKYLAFSQSSGKTTIFSDVKGIALQSIREDNACNSLRWNPMEQRSCLLEGYANGAIHYRLIKPNLTNQIIQTFEVGENIEESSSVNNNSINCLEFMPSGLSFLSGSSDASIRQYDIVTGKKVNTISYHKNRVFAIKSIDDQCFLSAGWDHTVFLYDLRSQRVQKYIYGPMVFGDSLDFRNYQVLCGSWREFKQLEIFDLRNDQSEEIKWENISKNEVANFVYCCQFSKVNNKHIVAGSTGKYELRVFDREDNNICIDAIDKTLTKGVFSLDFRNTSNHLSFGTSDACYGLLEII